MLAELDILIYVRLQDSDLGRAAERVFTALGSPFGEAEDEEWGGKYYQAAGLGFEAALFANGGEMLDPEFEEYPCAVAISSRFWCVELDGDSLEEALSEYFARLLAFELNVETATTILQETTEEAEIFEVRIYRRNPNYRLDQAPTTPKVFVIETRQLVEPFEDEGDSEYGEEFDEDDEEDGEDL